jgi:hypothetical protein
MIVEERKRVLKANAKPKRMCMKVVNNLSRDSSGHVLGIVAVSQREFVEVQILHLLLHPSMNIWRSDFAYAHCFASCF